MSEIVKKLGLLVLLIGFGLLFYAEFVAKDQPLEKTEQYRATSKSLLIIGALILLGGYGLGFLGRAKDAIAKPRCIRCGSPVRKGQIYCPNHQKEIIENYKDRVESETGSRKRRHPGTG